ncbi:MAG: molybdate ABC transporter permease subunit [Hyphomicrobiales bacterium]|nr:molybdate ABC transporter permease subunit [Hyphomicrobiales bacterium]
MSIWAPLTPEEWQAARLSLQVASVAALVSAPFAVAAAYALSRPAFFGKTVLDALIHAPLVLPPVVIGYLLLLTFGVKGAVGGWLYETFGVRFIFNWTGAALAAGVVSFPLQVRAIRLAMEAVDPRVVAAAESLGAGPVDRFFTIVLPLALPGVAAGVITGFAAGLGEFGAVITFASNIPGETRTLPLAIYTSLQTPGGEAAAARLAALSIALAIGGLAVAEVVARRLRARLA